MIIQIFKILLERKNFFLDLLWQHIYISFTAVIIAAVIGLGIGIFIERFRYTSKIVLSVVNFLYTIPSIALLGFLIPFSGIGNKTAITALIIYAMLPMVRNTYIGLANVSPAILEASKGMGSTTWQTLFRIKFPLAFPVIFSGFRSMVTMTIALAGIASFIGAGGLGVAIYRGITTNNPIMTLAGSLLIAFLAIFFDTILNFGEKLLTKRKKSKYIYSIIAGIIGVIVLIKLGISLFFTPVSNVIHIATKPMTEQYILGEMLKELIEHDTDLTVKLTSGVGGGTTNIQLGMEAGKFDLYPEYTGTGWNQVLKEKGIYTEKLFEEMNKKYQEDFKMVWFGMYGFNNTYGLAVSKKTADKYNLKTYSDLAKISDSLIFGAEYDFFEREDGYDALSKAYHMSFSSTMDMDIGLKYQAMKDGKIDVMNIFTTDGQLAGADIVVLEDDLSFYPSYKAGNIVRTEVFEAHPELKDVLLKLENTITDSDMAEMNYQVESMKQEPGNVAHKFLAEKGYVGE